ncbi:MAG: GH92 family glycosyl hydrolase [Bacteroidales bacterium]|nr:GH92 family glycosyl hydrolase [Bacteroidales bacterium]
MGELSAPAGLLQDYIDTRVGTDANALNSGSRFGSGTEVFGQTLPAVTEPNGMNFWTPQTRDTEKKGVAPYYYRDTLLQGFRNSHWIVGGCTQDYGTVTIFPATGVGEVLPERRATVFDHRDEVATPSYYSVYLKGSGILAEMTGRSRSAIFRFTYPEGEPSYLIVNPNSDEGCGYVEIDTLKREIRGYNPIHRIYQGWGEPAGHSGHFVIRYYDDIESFGTYGREGLNEGSTGIGGAKDIGLYVRFRRTGGPVTVKVSSSFTDLEGAGRNLDSEIPHSDFDRTRSELSGIWEKHLGRVEAASADTVLCRKFYGALYRASFLPRTISDADGRYPQFASGVPVLTSDTVHYDDFSMWDTYRALHPLLVLLDPKKDGDMMQSLVDKYEQGGWLPIFPCWNSYTAAMIGDHCIAALGDAIVKGVDNFDVETAYEAMRKNAFETPADSIEYAGGMGRRALKSYLEYGYIPLEDEVREAFHSREQTSRTLEYAYDDFVLAQVALKLGRKDDYARLIARSRNYRNVIDPSTGYANGRYADGRFFEHNDVDAYARYVTEGAPCHYTWYVPHDPYGLMEMTGGRDGYVGKLDRLFTERLYWHGNEPCHQVAYMYGYAGQAWKTQKYVRDILDNEYADMPGGLAGNDDAGQMSAWLIFSSLGFYPVCPGKAEYMIGSPQFDRAVLHLEGGRSFTILTVKTGTDNRYVQSVTLNGRAYDSCRLKHGDLVGGGVMVFTMGDTPNEKWGTEYK